MTISEIKQVHVEESSLLTADKTHTAYGPNPDPDRRADQCVIALRHILCCWILTEATEEQLQTITKLF